jgi:hypothetical protein
MDAGLQVEATVTDRPSAQGIALIHRADRLLWLHLAEDEDERRQGPAPTPGRADRLRSMSFHTVHLWPSGPGPTP